MNTQPLYMKIISYVMALLFITAALVQYNDPDAFLWMVIYGAAAVITIFFILGKITSFVTTAATVATLVVAVTLGYEAFTEGFRFTSLGTWQMENIAEEKAREAGGMVFITLWMLVMTFQLRKSDTIR